WEAGLDFFHEHCAGHCRVEIVVMGTERQRDPFASHLERFDQFGGEAESGRNMLTRPITWPPMLMAAMLLSTAGFSPGSLILSKVPRFRVAPARRLLAIQSPPNVTGPIWASLRAGE